MGCIKGKLIYYYSEGDVLKVPCEISRSLLINNKKTTRNQCKGIVLNGVRFSTTTSGKKGVFSVTRRSDSTRVESRMEGSLGRGYDDGPVRKFYVNMIFKTSQKCSNRSNFDLGKSIFSFVVESPSPKYGTQVGIVGSKEMENEI